MLRDLPWKLVALVAALVPGLSLAQDYPNRAIRILTAQAGGGNDFVARILAPALSESVRQPVVIDNRSGIVSAAGSVAPHIKSGRLKALAVTSPGPSALVPGVAPVSAALPGFEVVSIIGFLAPAKTPDAVVNRLSQEITRVLARPDIRERFFASGAEAIGSTPELFGQEIRAEMDKWGKLIKAAGLRAQ